MEKATEEASASQGEEIEMADLGASASKAPGETPRVSRSSLSSIELPSEIVFNPQPQTVDMDQVRPPPDYQESPKGLGGMWQQPLVDTGKESSSNDDSSDDSDSLCSVYA